jgi:hypothetical protein
MSSPFQTIDEFNGAIDGPTEGAIYTFANSPAINNIALLAAVALFIWFLVGTYSAHHSMPKLDKSLNSLSTAIVVGLLSLVAADFRQQAQEVESARKHQSTIAASPRANLQQRTIPLGLLGMVGLGASPAGRLRHRRRHRRSLHR